MATVTAFIRPLPAKDEEGEIKKDKAGKTIPRYPNKPINVRFRFSDGRLPDGIQLFHKSELSVTPERWDESQQKIKARCIMDNSEKNKFDADVNDRKKLINKIYDEKGRALTSELLEIEIDKALHPENYETPKQTFFETFEEFLEKHKLSDVRRKNYRVIYRCLKRFELYVQKTISRRKNFALELDGVTSETLQQFSNFLKNEHVHLKELPELYKQFPEYHEQKPRGQNTINDILKKVKTFFIWCIKNKKTDNNPFGDFKIEGCVYGTPFYITIDERNHLYKLNLTDRPELETQRDIFVFQCLVGCRIGDLYKLKKENVINGAIEYIPRKTKDSKQERLRVPLNNIAKEILEKYADIEEDTLLPFISQQKYNEAIKKAFTSAGITRNVVVCDPLTRDSIIRPINEVASSHLARRCFVGNLYKQVKDPNLVGALSGHKEGSRAFARYREIDEEMKSELVKMLE